MTSMDQLEDKDELHFYTKDELHDAVLNEAAQDQGQSGAFNPETKEINWDCPCLAGMADPSLPCTPEFKAAFSCFVFSGDTSEDESYVKGSECVSLFKGMQDCFMRYPEVYAEQLKDDEDDVKVGDNDREPNAVAVAADQQVTPQAETAVPTGSQDEETELAEAISAATISL